MAIGATVPLACVIDFTATLKPLPACKMYASMDFNYFGERADKNNHQVKTVQECLEYRSTRYIFLQPDTRVEQSVLHFTFYSWF